MHWDPLVQGGLRGSAGGLGAQAADQATVTGYESGSSALQSSGPVIVALRGKTAADPGQVRLGGRCSRSEIVPQLLCPMLAHMELSADRAHRGNPVCRQLPREQLSRPQSSQVRDTGA